MKLFRLVITGGPCGGKSTALDYVRRTAEAEGFRVLTVSETATELIGGGVAPWTCATNATYQGFQIALQAAKEEIFLAAAATMDAEKILILYDRGLLDNRAYMTEAEFSACLAARGETVAEYLSRYDAVFHLVTAACGAEAYYTTANNAARTEAPEEARAVDARLISAWAGHPRHIVIDNRGNFADKMARLTASVRALLEEV